MEKIKKKLFVEISNKYGLPIYIYDEDKIVQQFEKLKKAFADIENLKINYAIKALSNISILKIIKKIGGDVDAVSIEEVKIALHAGFKPNQIFFTPSGVDLSEIESALNYGVQINIDNYRALKKISDKFQDISVGIRINPNIYAGGNSKISVGHSESKFGITVEEISKIKNIVKNKKIEINGIHMHTGSDIDDINMYLKACDVLFNAAEKFKKIKFLDFGSGFKVKYSENDFETDIEELGKNLSYKFNKFILNKNSKIRFHIEPGKFIVSEAGVFLTKVNYVNPKKNINFLHVNSGLNHFIRPMFYGSKHSIINITSSIKEKENYSVVGYVCETDTFAENISLNKTSEGDILCFKNAGAYCFSMSSNYNSRLKPAEVLISKGKIKLIRKREKFDDLLKNQL
tara:strand:- start:40 stop:1242 length:1203 start_codon:yes stop_codon:yes gene_type:complete